MCDVCVINSVKERMLSRRSIFKAAAGLSAAAALSTASPIIAPAYAATGTNIDMTHTLSPEFPTYGGAPGISKPMATTSTSL
jgi:hypothetical protein